MKNYLLIGASTGIGRELAAQLATAGNTVFATYNKTTPQPLTGVTYFKLDVLSGEFDFSALPEVIHGFVYLPGSINLKPFTRFTAQDFRNDYELQVTGAVNILAQILPKLKKSGNASLIFFSTVAVQTGFPYHTLVSASKGAIEGLTRALAAELAPAIRVNCIAPALTDTPLASSLLNTDEKRQASEQRHPLKRIGKPEDIASLAAFLLSDKAAFITGQIIKADGGIGTLKI